MPLEHPVGLLAVTDVRFYRKRLSRARYKHGTCWVSSACAFIACDLYSRSSDEAHDERRPARAFDKRSLGPGNIPVLRHLLGWPRVQSRVQAAAGEARADLPPVHRNGSVMGA